MSRVTEQFDEAKRYLAGGVSSSTRVNRALGHPYVGHLKRELHSGANISCPSLGPWGE